ncbi:MAG: hypothetical protein V3T86_00955 [Planctomycetota bacterium]
MSASFVTLTPRWKRIRQRTVRTPSLRTIVFLLAFPATLFWDDYRMRIIVRGADGAFDAVRSLTLAITAYGAVEILLGALARPRPRGFVAVAAGTVLAIAAAIAAALFAIS